MNLTRNLLDNGIIFDTGTLQGIRYENANDRIQIVFNREINEPFMNTININGLVLENVVMIDINKKSVPSKKTICKFIQKSKDLFTDNVTIEFNPKERFISIGQDENKEFTYTMKMIDYSTIIKQLIPYNIYCINTDQFNSDRFEEHKEINFTDNIRFSFNNTCVVFEGNKIVIDDTSKEGYNIIKFNNNDETKCDVYIDRDKQYVLMTYDNIEKIMNIQTYEFSNNNYDIIERRNDERLTFNSSCCCNMSIKDYSTIPVLKRG